MGMLLLPYQEMRLSRRLKATPGTGLQKPLDLLILRTSTNLSALMSTGNCGSVVLGLPAVKISEDIRTQLVLARLRF
jgi:hypothetical protein